MAKIDDEIKTRFANDKHRFITNVIYTSAWVRGRFAEFIKPFGLSQQQFNILRILRGAEDWVAMNDVKHLMIEKSPNATRLVDKLLEKELVNRKRSESDRRVVYINITKKGLGLLKDIDDAEYQSHMDFLKRISVADAKKFSEILDKMRG
jgi:DNA-binding MarR family transcriptional regulator